MWDSHGWAVRAVTLVWMMDGVWEAGLSRSCREPPWAVEQAVVIDAVSPAVLFTFSPLLYCIFPNFFLCTRWAEPRSGRSVTHSAGGENTLTHTRMESCTELTAHVKTFSWVCSLYWYFLICDTHSESLYRNNIVLLFVFKHWWHIISVVVEEAWKYWTCRFRPKKVALKGKYERTSEVLSSKGKWHTHILTWSKNMCHELSSESEQPQREHSLTAWMQRFASFFSRACVEINHEVEDVKQKSSEGICDITQTENISVLKGGYYFPPAEQIRGTFTCLLSLSAQMFFHGNLIMNRSMRQSSNPELKPNPEHTWLDVTRTVSQKMLLLQTLANNVLKTLGKLSWGSDTSATTWLSPGSPYKHSVWNWPLAVNNLHRACLSANCNFSSLSLF